METITRSVADLTVPDRSAMERVVGHPLRETQRIVVNIIDPIVPIPPPPGMLMPEGIPPEWNVYEGLSDEEIEVLTAAITKRCNLSRTFE